MRYRALTSEGDYQLGRTGLFLVDTPEAVAQAIKTRLGLMEGEWFLDTSEGTPYASNILGMHTSTTRDLAIKMRILDTPGVQDITNYYSYLNADRVLVVAAEVSTIYGNTTILQQV